MNVVPLPRAIDTSPTPASGGLMQSSAALNNTNTNMANDSQNQRSTGSGSANGYLDYTNLLGFFGNDDTSMMGGNAGFGSGETGNINDTGGRNAGGSLSNSGDYPNSMGLVSGDTTGDGSESLLHSVLSIPPTYQFDFDGFGGGYGNGGYL
ncbi:unnamed protein product [Ambrosiozyma monospora]|uniref:Unnamed protein product n=1 Tax=Ambrosiozyma monospora TaxID=43982 RepID=A0ACB5U676_AMBMO|nr:unnamed protein product [Ambrosiozyma monospora]